MKNIFDLNRRESELTERKLKLEAHERVIDSIDRARKAETRNEIAEIKSLHSKEMQSIELAHKSEVAGLKLTRNEDVATLKIAHDKELSTLREEMKSELGAKAIDLEKQLSILEERERLLYTEIDDLRSDNARLEKELKEMTATALKYAEKSAEVRVVEPQIITPQILESKINVIPTCKG